MPISSSQVLEISDDYKDGRYVLRARNLSDKEYPAHLAAEIITREGSSNEDIEFMFNISRVFRREHLAHNVFQTRNKALIHCEGQQDVREKAFRVIVSHWTHKLNNIADF